MINYGQKGPITITAVTSRTTAVARAFGGER
jgi:hypothetical protein